MAVTTTVYGLLLKSARPRCAFTSAKATCQLSAARGFEPFAGLSRTFAGKSRLAGHAGQIGRARYADDGCVSLGFNDGVGGYFERRGQPVYLNFDANSRR